MNMPLISILALLAASIACAQDNPTPASAAADAPAAQPQTEMQKWIATTDAQWQAVFKRDVTDVHEAEAKKLMLQYLNLLEDAIARASKAGDLDGAVALRAEQKRFGDTQLFPEEDDAADPAAVKQARAAIRALLAKLKMESAVRAKALLARYDQVLAQAQAQLTQRQRLDDALLVKAKREEVAAAWITPAVAIAAADAAAAQAPKEKGSAAKTVTPPKVPFGTKPAGGLAQVEAENAAMAPLAKGEAMWSDRNNNFLGDIPGRFRGYQFTRSKAHDLTLSFKVLADGLVYMGCTKRWGTTATPDVAKDFATAQTLKKDGWLFLQGVEISTSASDMTWVIFSRQCKAGEHFSYRTDKYAPPILLVK